MNIRFYSSYDIKITLQSLKSHFMCEIVKILPYKCDIAKSIISLEHCFRTLSKFKLIMPHIFT